MCILLTTALVIIILLFFLWRNINEECKKQGINFNPLEVMHFEKGQISGLLYLMFMGFLGVIIIQFVGLYII